MVGGEGRGGRGRCQKEGDRVEEGAKEIQVQVDIFERDLTPFPWIFTKIKKNLKIPDLEIWVGRRADPPSPLTSLPQSPLAKPM